MMTRPALISVKDSLTRRTPVAGAGLTRTRGAGPADGSAGLSGALDEDTGLVGGPSEETTELSSSEAR